MTRICGPQPGINPNKIAIIGTNGVQTLKSRLKSVAVKYIKPSYIMKADITHVVTKFVVSITLDKYERDFSVEHWKSLNGFNAHMKIEIIAPIETMRFDDSFYRFFGDQLIEVEDSLTVNPEVGTYGGRSLGATTCPGILVDSFSLTL